jgi:hypothetical protein
MQRSYPQSRAADVKQITGVHDKRQRFCECSNLDDDDESFIYRNGARRSRCCTLRTWMGADAEPATLVDRRSGRPHAKQLDRGAI